MNRITIKALFLLTLIAFPIGKVAAGLSITPAFVRMDQAVQGKSYRIPIKVTNQSAKKTEYFVVGVESPHGKEKINGLPAKRVIAWTKFKPGKFTLQPGESRKVLMTVKVPKGRVGDYRLYLTVAQDPEKYNLEFKKVKAKSAVGVMQLGKVSTRLPEFKTHVKSLIKINIPIVIRAKKPGSVIKVRKSQVKLSKFKLAATKRTDKSMSVKTLFTNNTKYDVILSGSCSLLNKKGSKKLAQVDLATNVLIQPKENAPINCDFSSALPQGRYQVQGNFKVKVKGTKTSFNINKRQKIKISKKMARMFASQGGGEQDIVRTPVLLSVKMLEQTVTKGKFRKQMVEIVNPTSKKLNINAKFKLSNTNRVKVIIRPSKFKLTSGQSKRISIEFKSKDKGKPVFGWLEFRAKQAKGAVPEKIAVMLVPEGLKLQNKIKIDKIKATLNQSNTRLTISANIFNSKEGKEALYLNATMAIEDLQSGMLALDKEIKISESILLPGDKAIISTTIDFDKLIDGVYKINLNVTSNKSRIRKGQYVNIVVNRDIANKVKVVAND
jgi:hypothetical protein